MKLSSMATFARNVNSAPCTTLRVAKPATHAGTQNALFNGEGKRQNVKDIQLLLEMAQNISNDKIVDAVSFAVQVDSIRKLLVCGVAMFCFCYFLYKMFNN